MHVGQTIRARREALKLKQGRTADAAGMLQSTLCKIELGHREPSLCQLRALATVLETTVAELVGEEPAEPQGAEPATSPRDAAPL